MTPRIPAAARLLVQQHQRDGDAVVMSTATSHFITELTAAHLSIEHLLATECEVAADGCFNDLPLLLAVRHAVAVDPDARLRGIAEDRGWKVLRFR